MTLLKTTEMEVLEAMEALAPERVKVMTLEADTPVRLPSVMDVEETVTLPSVKDKRGRWTPTMSLSPVW